MATPVLEAKTVSVVQNGHELLSDISLAIPEGERVLVHGPSGAGKTSLFHVLGLLSKPTTGEILVEGTSASGLSQRERARIRRDTIGFVFQEFQLIPDLTARKNAALPQTHTDRRDEAWLDELFARLDIEDIAGQYPRTLSGGEKQRVGIARALANRPAVVLADEPTGHLDSDASQQVLDLLFETQEMADTALVVTSHDRGVVEQFPTKHLIVDGRLSDEGATPRLSTP